MPRIVAPHGAIAYEDDGDGVPLVLINGLGSQLIRWPVEFLAALRRRGFRVIRFDNRDAGLSHHHAAAGTPDLRALGQRIRSGEPLVLPYTLSDMASDVTTLLDALYLTDAHVLGMSMGGFVAQLLAVAAPRRVRSLTLLMTSSGNPALPGPAPRAQAVLQRRATPGGDREALIADGVVTQRAIGSPAYPADADAVRARVAAEIDRAHDPAGYVRQRAAILADGDRRARLGAISCPTLVLHGEDDPLVDVAAGRELAALIAGARLVTFPGMGHEIPPALATRIADEVAAVAAVAEPR